MLQVIRLATRRGAAHDQQIIVLSLLHFVAGTVLGGGLTYGLCFLGFLVVAPGALVLSHLRREVEGNYRQGARDRTGLPVDVPRILRSRRGRPRLPDRDLPPSVPIFLFTATLFVLFPRVGLSLLLLNHPRPGRMVGFSDKVDLGEVGVLRNDPSIALRFEVQDLPDPPQPRLTLRLRGTAFDEYDGRAWARTQKERFPPERGEGTDTPDLPVPRRRDRSPHLDRPRAHRSAGHLPAAAERRDPRQAPEPVDPRRAVHGAARTRRGLRYGGNDARGLRYDAFVAPDRETLSENLAPADRERYLRPPRDFPHRIGELAHAWADAQPTSLLKARALEEHLKKEFLYDTNSPSGGKPQPVDHFLFESKRGHCEFFSTAMAMMLRELGIPSRNVTGFVGGTYNRFGHYYAVREGDAHSWVEAYIDETHAWQTFDPTPTSGAQPLQETTGAWVYFRDLLEALSQRWNRYVVGYDLRTQIHIFEDLSKSYERMRANAGVNKGPLERMTRAPAIAGGALVLALAAYAVWRRRERATARRKARSAPDEAGSEPRDGDGAVPRARVGARHARAASADVVATAAPRRGPANAKSPAGRRGRRPHRCVSGGAIRRLRAHVHDEARLRAPRPRIPDLPTGAGHPGRGSEPRAVSAPFARACHTVW